MDISTTKQKLARFGRAVAMLLNRGMMYQKNHPMVKESVKEVFRSAQPLFSTISPLVFILNRDQFYADEEPLDPRINVKRIANLFEKNGIQSVSFDKEVTMSEIDIFIGIFSSLTQARDADDIKKELFAKGAYNVQINHVIYKKVTEDDQIISREALKSVTPELESDDQDSRKRFMETLLESLLTEEFAKTLNIQSLISDPAAVSKNIIKADLANANRTLADSAAYETLPDGDMTLSEQNPSLDRDGEGAGAQRGHGAGPGAGSGFLGDAGPGTGSDTTPDTSSPGAGTDLGRGGGVSGATGGTGLHIDGHGAGSVMEAGLAETGPEPGPGTGGRTEPAGTEATAALPSVTPQPHPPVAGHGPLIMHQLDVMSKEVEKHLKGEGDVSLEELANAIFEMKKELLEGIETQKALGVAYANEAQIIQSANQLTDKVILELIRDEYKSDPQMPIKRMALIITRLVPEAMDLKRLLPQIKQTLIHEGLPLAGYLDLVQELKNELQSDELARILQESSDTIGVDSQGLLNEIKQNPSQAAKLIYLASEIRKGTGDASALSDILVDYVEQIAVDAAENSTGEEENHIEKVVSDIESTIVSQLGKMNVDKDVLLKMEDRINDRMESILDKMRVEWLKTQSIQKRTQHKSLTVLQTLEHNVGDDDELGQILKVIRSKVEAGEIDGNNFSQIQKEISQEKERLKTEVDRIQLPEGVLKSEEIIFVLDKEIARTNRYSAPFSALAFSFVKAKPKMKSLHEIITTEAVMVAALDKLSETIREVDYLGQIGKNKMVALLPMLAYPEAKMALSRVLNLLHSEPLKVHGVPVQLRVAGVVVAYDSDSKMDAHAFAKHITNQLMDMVARIKNIQVLF